MRSLCLAAVWLAGAATALAQAPPRVSVSAGPIAAWLIRGEVCCQSNPSLPTTGIGGVAPGAVLALDVGVSRRLGIGAELSVAAMADDQQEAAKYRHRTRTRDTILSGYVRIRLRPDSSVRVEPVAGAGVAFSDVRIASSNQVFVPSPGYGPFGDYVRWPYGETRLALSGGLDVPIGRGHVVVVPTVRVHYIRREEVLRDQIGLGHWSIRPGVAVRIGF